MEEDFNSFEEWFEAHPEDEEEFIEEMARLEALKEYEFPEESYYEWREGA